MSWFVKRGDDVYGNQEWGPPTLVHMKATLVNGESNEWRTESAINSTLVGSIGSVHIHITDQADHLYLANYGGASLTVVPLNSTGHLPDPLSKTELDTIKTYSFECGDKTSRPHQTVTKGPHVWVVDLGCNKIRHFKKSEAGADGTLEEQTGTDVPADRGDLDGFSFDKQVNIGRGAAEDLEKGRPAWSELAPCASKSEIKEHWNATIKDAWNSTVVKFVEKVDPKPRHMALHPTKDLAYVILEGQPYVEVYDVDATSGALQFKQRVVLTEEYKNESEKCPPFRDLCPWCGDNPPVPQDNLPYYGAEILVSPNGKNVYASSRRSRDRDPDRDTRGIITVYEVDQDGTLKKPKETKLEGKWCRSMELVEHLGRKLLAVALEDKDQVQFFDLSEDGTLKDKGPPVLVDVKGIEPAFIMLDEKAKN